MHPVGGVGPHKAEKPIAAKPTTNFERWRCVESRPGVSSMSTGERQRMVANLTAFDP
jgi:hypothetical protein